MQSLGTSLPLTLFVNPPQRLCGAPFGAPQHNSLMQAMLSRVDKTCAPCEDRMPSIRPRLPIFVDDEVD